MSVVNSLDSIKSELVILLWNTVIFLLEILDPFFELLDQDQIAVNRRPNFALKLIVPIVW